MYVTVGNPEGLRDILEGRELTSLGIIVYIPVLVMVVAAQYTAVTYSNTWSVLSAPIWRTSRWNSHLHAHVPHTRRDIIKSAKLSVKIIILLHNVWLRLTSGDQTRRSRVRMRSSAWGGRRRWWGGWIGPERQIPSTPPHSCWTWAESDRKKNNKNQPISRQHKDQVKAAYTVPQGLWRCG